MLKARRINAVVQTGAGKLEQHEFARPTLGPDDAILRLEACGICGTDVAQYDGHYESLGVTRYPFVPGHEPLGVIDEIGERAASRWGVAPGDRVAVEPLLPCNHCDQCLRGQRTDCTGWGRMVSYGFMETGFDLGVSGAFADHLYLHPNTLVHRISPTLPASVAVMFNPLGAGVRWSYQVPDLRLGDTVVVLGAGQRGLCCVVAARAAGAGLIIVSDIAAAQHKLDLARDLGADAVVVADEEDLRQRVTELTGGRLADLVVNVAAGAPELVADAVNLVRNGGTIILAGLTGGQAVPQFISDELVLRSITLRGVFAVDTAAYRHAIRLLESGNPVIARMHTRSYGLAEAEQAILHHAGRLDAPPAVHLALTPGAGR